jgi:hypothetical protein
MMGWKSLPMLYHYCLVATIGRKGLALALLFPFRFMHRPLFIPWEAVERCRRVRNFLWDDMAIYVEGFHRRFELGGALGAAVHEAWKESRDAAKLQAG